MSIESILKPQEQTADLDHDAFACIKIGIASPQRILSWSRGEVTKPETINYRTLKPERDGLFCEKIFGPAKDWECHCGKYKRVRHRGIICERCGVEVTDSKVRRHRMGHIRLAAPIVHIWYLKGIPSYMSLLLDMPLRALEEVTYYNAYTIVNALQIRDYRTEPETSFDPSLHQVVVKECFKETIKEVTKEALKKKKFIADLMDAEGKIIFREPYKEIYLFDKGTDEPSREVHPNAYKEFPRGQLLTEEQFEHYCDIYSDKAVDADMGAPAIKQLLSHIELKQDSAHIWHELLEEDPAGQKKVKLIKRLRVLENFIDSQVNPTWMVLDIIPVIPPDLRPMVQLDGGRFATSDLNDLYRRVINRNNRLNRLLEMEAPDIIIRNEKRMLQEAVDALFDNGRRGRAVLGPNNRQLKSLSDIVEGKQGRFRQNLLGKRVDYSGRSVIVVGPNLKLHQCGLPKEMALELFKPFVMNKLVEQGVVQNIKSAKKSIERQDSVVWDILENVIKGHPVLLNRAPTLHRLGIQAFEPVLVEGRAIQLHPLVCTAFNADFDGDQMAVHVPLSIEAQTEARLLMMANNNILLPATGRPAIAPSQDMVIGCFYISLDNPNSELSNSPLPGNNKVFSSVDEVLAAYQCDQVDKKVHVHAKVIVRFPTHRLPDDEPVMLHMGDSIVLNKDGTPKRNAEGKLEVTFAGKTIKALLQEGVALPHQVYIRTTPGRLLLNELFPKEFAFRNQTFGGPQLSDLVGECYRKFGSERTALLANDLKNAGFRFATMAGVSITIADLEIPEAKKKILEDADKEDRDAEYRFQRGLITETERHSKVISTWHEATEKLTECIKKDYNRLNSVYMMAFSGARGNISQVRQLIGMRGLMADPSGKIMDLAIKSNFKEGLNVTEYVLSSYGARKGIVDTALRTADSGYLTRRLADVAQDVIILDEDCGTLNFFKLKPIQEGENVLLELRDRLTGRAAATDLHHPETGKLLVARNQLIEKEQAEALVKAGFDAVPVRSPVGCESEFGVCRLCYGVSLTNNRLVDRGEPIGIIAAQSIGEPGTQLTMRTFHTGGVFEGAVAERVLAPMPGVIKYKLGTIQEIRTHTGNNVDVLDKETKLILEPSVPVTAKLLKHAEAYGYVKIGKDKAISFERLILPGFSMNFKNGAQVEAEANLAIAIRESGKFGRSSMERKEKEVIANVSGQVRLDGITTETRTDKQKQQKVSIVNSKDGKLWIYNGNVYTLPPKSEITVESEQKLKSGETIGRIATTTEFGGRVSLSKGEEGATSLSIVTSEISIKDAEVKHHKQDMILHFTADNLAISDFTLISMDQPDSRLENNTIIAEAFDERFKVERNGVIHYVHHDHLHEKEPITKEVEALLLHEEIFYVKGNTPLVDFDQEVEADHEIMTDVRVTESGFVSTENLETSQELIFYPGAKVYRFSDEDEATRIKVEENLRIKKNAELGERLNLDTGEVETVQAEIDGIVQILPAEGESLVIVRPYTRYKIKPIDKFFDLNMELESNLGEMSLEPITRLMHRHGDRIKAGERSTLTKVQLQFKLSASLVTLGGRVRLDPLKVPKPKEGEEEQGPLFRLSISCIESLSTQKGSLRGAFLPEYQDLQISIIPLVKNGQLVEPKSKVASTEYKVEADGTISIYKDPNSGLVRMMLLTSDHEEVVPLKSAPSVKVDQHIFEGDELAKGVKSPATGIIASVTDKQLVIHKARPYLVSQGSQLVVSDKSMIRQGEVIVILTYEQMKTGDIIQGLPRVEELLETRKPKETAVLSEWDGEVVLSRDNDDNPVVSVKDTEGLLHPVSIPHTASPLVINGQGVKKGDRLTTGAVNPHDLLRILNVEAAQRYLVDSVQMVYRSQGVKISDKHIEVIVRQMTRKCRIENPGESTFLPGEIVSEVEIQAMKRKLAEEGLVTETLLYTPILLGITKASLNTESFISAASFQETTRVLTEAAVEGKRDWLRGLKENVIIGRLIPAGTGMRSKESRDDLRKKQRNVIGGLETKAIEPRKE